MTEKRRVRSVIIEDVGYVYTGFYRGEDVWGNWHEEDWFCHIETKDGKTIDVAESIAEVFELEYNYCAMHNHGTQCEEEREDDECPYKDEKGICRPPLFKFKISVEVEPLRQQSWPKRHGRFSEESAALNGDENIGCRDAEVYKSDVVDTKDASMVAQLSGNVEEDITKPLINLLMKLKEVAHRPQRRYYCFYKGKPSLESIFAVLIPSKKELTVRIRANPETFKDPKRLTREVYKKWFFTRGGGQEKEFKIGAKEQIDYTMELIEQSYEISSKKE